MVLDSILRAQSRQLRAGTALTTERTPRPRLYTVGYILSRLRADRLQHRATRNRLDTLSETKSSLAPGEDVVLTWPVPVTQPSHVLGVRQLAFGLVAAMPPAGAWFRAGKTPLPVYWEHGCIGNFLCIPRFEPERRLMCVLTTTRSGDVPECGTLGAGNRYATFDVEGWYIAYLFNNGIAVVSQTGEWGNHGQSDPSGFYVPSEAATRACPNQIAP